MEATQIPLPGKVQEYLYTTIKTYAEEPPQEMRMRGQELVDALMHAMKYVCDIEGVPEVSREELEQLVFLYEQHKWPPSYATQLAAARSEKSLEGIFRLAPYFARMTPLDWGILKAELKKEFKTALNLNDLQRAITDEKRRIELAENGERRDVADVARDWAITHRDTWGYDRDVQVWRVWNGFYWEAQTDTTLLDKEAVAALQEAGIDIRSLGGIACFQRLVIADCVRDFTPAPGLINFGNGTLHLNTGTLQPFHKEDNLIFCLPYGYNPTGTHPNIDAFLAQILPDPYAQMALMLHIGLALMRDTFIHQFIGLIGAKRAGKSIILALINLLCGAKSIEDAYSFAGKSIFDRELEGKRARSRWVHHPVVCVDELPPEALREEELLKTMTAHGGVEMRGIDKDEEDKNRWTPKIVFTTNDQPHYNDVANAIQERAIFLEVKRTIPKEQRNPFLLQTLQPELGAFAASCLDLAQELQRRGMCAYPQSAEMKAFLERISSEGNPLKDFLQEKCIIDKESATTRILTKTLHASYKEYCEQAGHKGILAHNTFSMALRSMDIGVTVFPHPIRLHGDLARGLGGIRLRTSMDPDATETSFQDDTLLPLPQRMGLYTMYTVPKETVTGTVYTKDQPVEPKDNKVYTMYTVQEENSSLETHLPPILQGGCPSKEGNGCLKSSYTSYTGHLDRPVEPKKDVYDGQISQNGTVYTVSGTVYTPGSSVPLWLTPGTRQWDRAVAREGRDIMEERRSVWMREVEQGLERNTDEQEKV